MRKNTLWHAFLDVLYPPRCGACDRLLSHFEADICTSCWTTILPHDHHFHLDQEVSRHFLGQVDVYGATAFLPFIQEDRIQHMMHLIKYGHQRRLAYVLGRWMGSHIIRSSLYEDVEAIVPVPLHPRRRRDRGYNQSHEICSGMADAYGRGMILNAIKRIHSTTSQTTYGRFSRISNMSKAFKADRELLKYSHVLLVDDVLTTGATLGACVRAIREMEITHGTKSRIKVSVAALAMGQ